MSDIEHHLYISSPLGKQLKVITDDVLASLHYGFRENEPGVLEFYLPPDFDTSLLVEDGIIDLYRSVGGGLFHLEGETSFLIRVAKLVTLENNVKMIYVLAYSAMEILARRIVAYYSSTPYSEKVNRIWDDLMREFVDENYGPGSSYIGASYGIDPDRNLEPYLTVESDISYGASYRVTTSKAWQNILRVLQGIVDDVKSSGEYCAFDVVKTGAGTFEFRVFIGARGTDRSQSSANPLILSENRYNLSEPSLELNYDKEVNFVFCGGRGESIDRVVKTASDQERIDKSPFNRREEFRDARQTELESSVQSEANSGLEEGRPKIYFTGYIRQTEGNIYGVHWNWGDIVTVEHEGFIFDCHIESVTVSVDAEGVENVRGYLRSVQNV